MADDELDAFRESWKRELTCKKDEQRPAGAAPPSWDVPGQSGPRDSKNRYFEDLKNLTKACSPLKAEEDGCTEDEGCAGVEGGKAAEETEDQPEYVSIARSLLDGRTSPLLDRIQEERTRRKRQYHNRTNDCSTSLQQQLQPQRKVKRDKELVDQLIQDLNEVNDIPFFDIELPYELALKIFQYLDCTELGRCAQVSRAWRVLAEDSVLWFKMCTREGYHQDASVSDSPCWKSTLRDCRNSAKTVSSNWKNRVGSISQLQFELGKVLCDVSSCDNFVLAGYTSGDVRLWDTLHWDSKASFLKPNSLSAYTDPRPHVSHVRVNSTVAAAAYEDGCVDLWSTETGGQPLYHYQSPGRIQALALSPDSPVLGSAAGPDVRLDAADDCGYWRTVCRAQLPKTVESLVLVPGRGQQGPLAALAAGEAVLLLDPRDDEPRTLHSVYGHPVTCLDASDSNVALGVKRTGWAMHDGGNKIHVYSLETGKSAACVGNSPGDFTCINLRDSSPHLLVCGNKDRRVRVFDLRAGSSVASLYAHHLGVTSVQADDWKIVSGGGEGLVCVWEMRMGAKLWEMHNRHPVRHVSFNTSNLVTANIPDDKSPRGACITDDDLTAHRRHRGVICHYDFSEDALSQDHILPICRSDYTESYGYNYNISLTVPYDRLSGSHPSH
ncbi:F-box/WD repeat-containing protein 8 isoform X2 [Seriola dumerili]|uniref:F-box/WD repeat-containing protein 8 n=1 Tax=Seriola dumerili TaxID=41447 RepID=A0A3B4UXW3_SERDU|nr:F-box/WD repeat-containing protein 8 isoform X1 [Seriola dumerili]XP_022608480.1 F-box/WD repeat-containing protein 8 isoform X2 [Seriola dumerili]